MDLREAFVLEALAPGANLSELCRQYEISRKTGYKWKAEYARRGTAGLRDRSRRPHRSPLRASAEVAIAVLELRDAHPTWGPKILHVVLARQLAADEIPSERTIARILERAGRVAPRRRRCDRRIEPITRPDAPFEDPNDLWTVDFKGWWRTRNRDRFEPLTIRDAASRYVLLSQHLSPTTAKLVRQAFEPVFVEYGLPRAILVDNGSPFVSVNALAGLTTLSAWWVSLGIRLVRSRPGHPQDNGGHERMHRTMAEDAEARPALNASLQQAALDQWRHEFNHVRPHRALAMQTPASRYARSPRLYQPIVELDYDDAYAIRTVSPVGDFKLHGVRHFLSGALRGHRIAIRQGPDDTHEVWFANHILGTVAPNTNKVLPLLDAT